MESGFLKLALMGVSPGLDCGAASRLCACILGGHPKPAMCGHFKTGHEGRLKTGQ